VLDHLLRIGRRTAVSLPNFGDWKVRLSLLTGGRMPLTRALDYRWFDTPNIHLCTLADFLDLMRLCGATVVEAHALREDGTAAAMRPHAWGPNLLAPGAIFLLKKS
jgi:methionine biosynthesis protein MetW